MERALELEVKIFLIGERTLLAITPLLTTFTYYLNGDKQTETLPNGNVTSYTYDDLNRLTDLATTHGGTTLFSQSYILNDDGTLHSVTETTPLAGGASEITLTTWSYDAEQRLTGETVSHGTSFASGPPVGLPATIELPASDDFFGLGGGDPVRLTWDPLQGVYSSSPGTTGESLAGVLHSGTAGIILAPPTLAADEDGDGTQWELAENPGDVGQTPAAPGGFFVTISGQGLADPLSFPVRWSAEDAQWVGDLSGSAGSGDFAMGPGDAESETPEVGSMGSAIADDTGGWLGDGGSWTFSDGTFAFTGISGGLSASNGITLTLANGVFTPDAPRGVGTAFAAGAGPSDYSDTFTYDLSSNRMKKVHDAAGTSNDVTTTYAYNGDDELIKQGPDANSDGVPDASTATTFAYNANGSQTTATTGSNVTTYGYDLKNKMISLANGTTTAATYVYDDAQNRVRETTSGTATYYLTDDDNPTGYAQPIEEKTSASAAPSMTYILGDHVLGQINSSGTTAYLQTDGHGSTRLLTNATGTVTSTLNYDEFGGALNFNPATVGTVFQFAGDSFRDIPSGLNFHGNGVRPRDEFVFKQMDTDVGNRHSPSSLHKRLYSNANPLNFNDPSGHTSAGEQAGVSGLASAIDSGEGQSFSSFYQAVGYLMSGMSAEQAALGLLETAAFQSISMASLRLISNLADAFNEGMYDMYNSGNRELRIDEEATQLRFMSENPHLNLFRSEHEGEEFVDQYGTTYDAMGKPAAYSNWNEEQFLASIDRHVFEKDADMTIIDLEGASDLQRQVIIDYVDSLDPAAQSAIKMVGL